MVVTREEIRERLRTESVWVTGALTPLYGVVPEETIRYVVGIWVSGNLQVTMSISFSTLKEDLTYETKFSPIPLAPTDFRQIPEGQYSLEDPFLSNAGGERLYAQAHGPVGHSVNASIAYYDDEIT